MSKARLGIKALTAARTLPGQSGRRLPPSFGNDTQGGLPGLEGGDHRECRVSGENAADALETSHGPVRPPPTIATDHLAVAPLVDGPHMFAVGNVSAPQSPA
jgi:hypothetical protein